MACVKLPSNAFAVFKREEKSASDKIMTTNFTPDVILNRCERIYFEEIDKSFL